MPQRAGGIDTHRTARRNQAPQSRGQNQDRRCNEKRGRVVGRNVDQFGFQQAIQSERRGQSDGEACTDRRYSLPQHKSENVTGRGTHRHTNPDLPQTPAHRMRDDRIQADRRKQERDCGENHEET